MSQENIPLTLSRMKDVSEAMIDLVQYAFIYNNEEIADHVLEMEARLDKVHLNFQLAVLKLKGERPAEGVLGLIHLALAAEQLADAAGKMATWVKRGLSAHPITRIALEEAEETVVSAEIKDASILVGKSLGEIGLEDDIGMQVIAIKRGEDWTYNPQDDFVIHLKDKMIVRGYAEGLEKFLTLTDPHHIHEQSN
jgi:uncharacterized protein with PhoU and TrkA domain